MAPTNLHSLVKRDTNGGMDTGAIVGIVIGVIVAVLLIIWAIRSLSGANKKPVEVVAPPPGGTYNDAYYAPRRSRSRSRHSHHHHHSGHHHHHNHRSSSRRHSRSPVVIEKPATAYVYPGDARRSRSRSQGKYYTSYQ